MPRELPAFDPERPVSGRQDEIERPGRNTSYSAHRVLHGSFES
jgi:hypothetical protein